MKRKKIIVAVLILVISLVCIGCSSQGASHEHAFGEWETKTAAVCESPEIEARSCECGEGETREGDLATGHTYTSISAVSKLEKPMAGMAVAVSDLSVTATCGVCGESVALTDGIELEDTTLVIGKNTVAVKYGELSTTLSIEAATLDIALDGNVTDDTHISSANKDKENSAKTEMGTKSDLYRIYFRTNISEILKTELFAANKDNAKVQLILAITGGSVTDKTTFKLKAYTPAAGVTDVDFSKLTWNNVDKNGAYGGLNWNNGTELVDARIGHNVSAENGYITVMLAYSQIADFVDESGNIVFAFATNTDKLKIGSLENKTETNRPAIKIVLNDEHFHVFDQKVTESKYFVSANCKERAKYHLSCACGEAGTETFADGGIIDHSYGKAIPEQLNTCTTDGVKEHYQCSRCGKYFLYRDGQMKLVKAEDVKLSAGHNYKEIPEKVATCTEAGNHKYYKCSDCGLYFDADKNETTKEAQKIDKLPHSYGDLIAQKDATCTEDGVKAHYECDVCHKTFLEKNGEKVVVSAKDLKISAGHDTKVIGATEATCTKDGNNKYYKCELCGKYFADKEGTEETTKEAQKITAGHTYSELVAQKDATCTEDGMKAHYRCTVCGKYFVEKDGQKVATSAESLKISAGHEYKLVQKQQDPTCTKHGWNKLYKCSDCGLYFDADKNETTKEAQKIPALGHTYGDLIPEKEKTCTADGMKAHYYCSVCDTYFDENKAETTEADLKIPADHDYKVAQSEKAPTCTESGWYKLYKCGDCGKYFDADKNETEKEDQRRPALGHTYGDLIPHVDATCTTDGMKAHYVCSVCGTYFDENKVETTEADLKISAGHDTKVIGANDPTCTKDGNNKYYQCKVCSKYFTDKEGTTETTKEDQKIPATGHSYGDLIPQVDATCTTDGMKAHYVCSVCGTYFDESKVETTEEALKIPAGHDTKVIAATEATCTKSGNNRYYQCKVCGKYFTDKEGTTETTKEDQKIPATGHSYGDLISQKDATCTEDGMKAHYQCSGCQKYFVDVDGEKVETTAEALKIAAGHTEVVDEATAPGCTTTGLTEGKHCSVCNEVLVPQEEVSATGHTEVVDVAVAATCTTAGLAEGKHCSVCNEVLTAQTVIAATGHTEVVDGAVDATCIATGLTKGKHCSVCGEITVAQEAVPMLNHEHTFTQKKAATCTTDGRQGFFKCNECDKYFVKVDGVKVEVNKEDLTIPATGHTDSDRNGTCDTCGESVS